jgi:site-specific DNA-methyltransferase (adenine-specific)
MGSGSTIAAAEAQGINSIGVERFADYFEMATQAIPTLGRLAVATGTAQLDLLDLLDA